MDLVLERPLVFFDIESTGTNPYRAKLKLTESGMEVAREVRQIAATVVDRVGGDLNPENRAVFYQVLSSVTANLETLCKELG